MESDTADKSSGWRDHVIMWAKDASRALDYAETRADRDHEKVANYGYSWGAVMRGLIPALEPRIKTNYRMLGAKKEQKKHLICDSGHNVPRNELIKETLNRLDQELGAAQ